MNVLSPWLLAFFLFVPFFIALYIWMLRRKKRFTIRYSSLALIREALPKRSRWQQHLPFAMFMLGFTSLITAMARPTAEIEIPLNRSTIILALDVSRSMCATDITPNRLTVAQDAALAFIEDQEAGTQIGLVAFAGFAELIVPPSNDKDLLREAIQNLTTSLGTAIGSATLKSIDAISEINDAVLPSGAIAQEVTASEPVEATEFQPEIIVLLTDGANSQGPQPLLAAQKAAERQVRVYTIGFGTTEITDMVCTQEQLGSDAFDDRFNGNGSFGGGFGGGGNDGIRRFLVIDEPTLQGVADITGGEYFRAENADQLLEVFLNLPSQIVLQKEVRELSVYFALLGAIMSALAAILSLAWNRFP